MPSKLLFGEVMTKLVHEIKKAVHTAALSNQKIAMFHFQILKNASALKNVPAIEFCEAISVPNTYATEYRKMMSLALIMEQQGYSLN